MEPWRTFEVVVEGVPREELEGMDEVLATEASAVRGLEAGVGVAAGSTCTLVTTRFWKSSRLLFKCSRGNALLAIPREYVSSASFRLIHVD